MVGQTVGMQFLGVPDQSQMDGANLQFAHVVKWLMENTTERERDLIYLVENFNRAWLTANTDSRPNAYSVKQLKEIERILVKYELSHLLQGRTENIELNGWDCT